MDSKQAPPAYSEAINSPMMGAENTGFAPQVGDQGGNPGGYPPQAGYPPGYSQVPGYGQQAGGYDQPAGGYGQPLPPGHYPQQGHPTGGAYGYHQTVVVSQPLGQRTVGVTAVSDHMGLAIFTTICCCWPLGLVAIMRAQESRRALERGDVNAASTYSAEARRYSMWAIAGGCFSIVVAIVIIIVYVTSVTSSTY